MSPRNLFSLAGAIGALVLLALVFWPDRARLPENPVMQIEDAYLRTSSPTSASGAAFLKLTNSTGQDDVLKGARSPLDGMIQLHSHTEDADGVMRMSEIEGGVPIAAGDTHIFERGGDHLMFMGLTEPLEEGAEVPVTLEFEKAGTVEVIIPVDRSR